MKVCNDVYVTDIYKQNTPQITTANAILTLQNEKGKTTKQDLRITVYAVSYTHLPFMGAVPRSFE